MKPGDDSQLPFLHFQKFSGRSDVLKKYLQIKLLFRDTRVKAIDSFNMEDYCVLVTASNDGFIKMWKVHLKEVCPCRGQPECLVL